MADLGFGGTDGTEGHDLVETGLAGILDEAATVCERLSADDGLAELGAGDLRDLLGVLHTMLDRAQELVGEMARELAAARRGGAPDRAAIDRTLAEFRAQQDVAVRGVRSYAEQVSADLAWRVGMLGEQVEVIAASVDALKPGGATAEKAVETALGSFEKEVGEFLALFRERAAKAAEAIDAAARERENALLAIVERAECTLRSAEAAGREREQAIAAMLERAERLAASSALMQGTIETKPVERISPANEVALPATKNPPKKSPAKPGSAKAGPKLTIKPPVTVKTKARSLRAAA